MRELYNNLRGVCLFLFVVCSLFVFGKTGIVTYQTKVQAQIPNSIYVKPAQASLPPDVTLAVRLNSGVNSIAFARVEIIFDQTLLQMTSNAIYPSPAPLKTLIYVTATSSANITGKFIAVVALANEDKDNAPAGDFEIMQFPFKTISPQLHQTAQLSFVQNGIQIVTMDQTLLPVTAYPASLTLNDIPTPTVLPRMDTPVGACSTDNKQSFTWTGQLGATDYWVQSWNEMPTPTWYQNGWMGGPSTAVSYTDPGHTIYTKVAWTNDPSFATVSEFSSTASAYCPAPTPTLTPTPILTLTPTPTPTPILTPTPTPPSTTTPTWTPTPTALPTPIPTPVPLAQPIATYRYLTSFSVRINWTSVPGADAYLFQTSSSTIKNITDGGYLCTLGTGSSGTVCMGSDGVTGIPTTNGWTAQLYSDISGLTCATGYYVHVKAGVTGTQNSGIWSEDLTFTTLPCPSPTPTIIPTPTPTNTPTPIPTSTPTHTPTPILTSTPTHIPTPTMTSASTPTRTPTPTLLSTPTKTPTPTPPSDSLTKTPTPSFRITPTKTPTHIPTKTPTPIRTLTPTQPPSFPIGDANHDGKVNEDDYTIWYDHFNSTTTAGARDGDFDKNGKVDGIDYVLWLLHYGT